MARIGIIGGGAFGTAMACVTRRSGNEVTLWAREDDVVASIAAQGENARFLPGVKLPPGIAATGELERACRDRDFLLTAVPAQHLRTVATEMRPFTRVRMPVVSCSKGIERGSLATMPEVLADSLANPIVAVLSRGRPSPARSRTTGPAACCSPARTTRRAPRSPATSPTRISACTSPATSSARPWAA